MTTIQEQVQEYKSAVTLKLATIWVVMMIVIAGCVFVTPDLSLRETMALFLIALLFSACMAAALRGNITECELYLIKTSPELKSKQ
jgi:K+-sensing histidine kinase KdpD